MLPLWEAMDGGESPEIAAAVATLARGDAGLAGDAAAALFWITGGHSSASISQDLVQNFCWHDLPVHWGVGLDRGLEVAEALARAFELLHMPRYAAICRSAATRRILAAYLMGPGQGSAAFRRAAIVSGIVPPDLPGFRWGASMGLTEASAWASTVGYLELAVVSGELLPGTHGWRIRQQELTAEYLGSTHAGQSLKQTIVSERAEIWVCARRSTIRMGVLTSLRGRLFQPTGLSPADADPLHKLRWLLAEADTGIPLTRAGYLDPEVVRRAAIRFGCAGPRPPRSEAQVTDLIEIRRFAQRLGLARCSGMSFAPTAAGRRLRVQPAELWGHCAAKLLDGTDFTAFIGELFLALAVSEHALSFQDICATVMAAVSEEEFRDRQTGEAPASEDIRYALSQTTGPMRALDLLSDRDTPDRLLTSAGEAMALEALCSRATGPVAVPC